ncbi:MAG TPA: peptidylprolyl isomerase [Stellaceae bacterium]|nr:peptidylprolyl isomerase [Stellaceae bacterium]
MMKIVAFILLLVSAGVALAQEENRIAAVVNDDAITEADVAARIKLVEVASNLQDTPDNEKRLAPEILRTLIDEKLQLQDAKKIGITVTPDEVEKALGEIEQRNNMKKGGLDAYLEQHGIRKSSLVDQITASLTFSKIVRARVSQDVQVSDDEVDDAMKRLEADVGKPQNRVGEIFLAVDNPSQEDDVRNQANHLIDDIRGGAQFTAIAQQFSQSPSAAVGGDIGWVTASELSPKLAEAVNAMSPGQLSYPIRTPAGFYILYLFDRKTLGGETPDDILLSLDEVIFAIPEGASDDERAKAEAQAQQVSQTAKSCGEMAKIGVDRAPQLSRQIPEMRGSDLPSDIRSQVLALKIAEPSKPLPLAGGVGVVMVCQRKDTQTLPTREQMSDNIARERLDALARRYMRDLRRGAYVDIRG